MDETLKQDLAKRFDILPPDLQAAISNIDLNNKIQEISKKNKLLIDQAGGLEIATLLVLFGFQPLGKYIDTLTTKANMPITQAMQVAQDVNESIFKNVRETLKRIDDLLLSGKENTEIQTQDRPTMNMNSTQNTTKPNTDTRLTINKNILPEELPKNPLSSFSVVNQKTTEYINKNIPPVSNVIGSKLNSTVTIPKQNIIIEEKNKIPQKPDISKDPYRESII